jgi:hypothetical protein
MEQTTTTVTETTETTKNPLEGTLLAEYRRALDEAKEEQRKTVAELQRASARLDALELERKLAPAAAALVDTIGIEHVELYLLELKNAKTIEEARTAFMKLDAASAKHIKEGLKLAGELREMLHFDKKRLIWGGIGAGFAVAAAGAAAGALAYRQGRHRGMQEIVDSRLEYALEGGDVHMRMNEPNGSTLHVTMEHEPANGR